MLAHNEEIGENQKLKHSSSIVKISQFLLFGKENVKKFCLFHEKLEDFGSVGVGPLNMAM